MKTRLFYFLAILSMAFMVVACGGPTEPEKPQELKEDIRLVSSSIAEGDVLDPTLPFCTLSYATIIKLDSSKPITLNGKAVECQIDAATGMTISVSLALESEQTYQLVVPVGAIRSFSDTTRTTARLELNFTTKKAGDIGLPDNEAMAVTHMLGFGWNLGNHFDTSSDKDNSPTPWGWWDNATPTESLYKNLKAAGISTVRMCVTWGNYQDPAKDYEISAAYMADVVKNVEWALNAGLYVILNTHHDEYWLDIMSAVSNSILNEQIESRITTTWTQIAEQFKSCDDHLIFETFNELHDESWGWNGGYNYTKVYALMEEWNQVATDAIRATGSNNATRWIAVPGFCASPSFTVGPKHRLVLPNDPANRIMVAMHTYDPYDFCTAGKIQVWGHSAPGRSKADEDAVLNLFKQIRNEYIENNVPCYMGEFGAVVRKSAADEKYRNYYHEYLCRAAYYNGIPVMVWDNDNPGPSGEAFYYINHNNGQMRNKALVDLMVKAATSTDPTYTLESVYAGAPK